MGSVLAYDALCRSSDNKNDDQDDYNGEITFLYLLTYYFVIFPYHIV